MAMRKLIEDIEVRQINEWIKVGERVGEGNLLVNRYKEYLAVMDMENAGQKGKKVDFFIVSGIADGKLDRDAARARDKFIVYIENESDYKKALATAKKMLGSVKGIKVEEHDVNAVSVPPKKGR